MTPKTDAVDPVAAILTEIKVLGRSIRRAEHNQEVRKARRDALIALAISRGVSQRNIARLLGISHVQVGNIAAAGGGKGE